MAYNLELHEQAEQELWDAMDYYDEKRKQLGQEFAQELRAIMKTVWEHPARFPTVKDNIRKAVVKKFPYIIIFEIQEDTVFVLAIFHTSRNPDSWEGRGLSR